MIIDVVKVFLPSATAFIVGIFLTPFVTHFLYSRKMWKKAPRTVGADGRSAVIFNNLHHERETRVPRMGGAVIWLSILLTAILFFALARFFPETVALKLDFVSRDQTWIPLATLLLGALVGLFDDIFDIRGTGDHIAGGLSLRKRLLFVSALSALVGSWFYLKLGVTEIALPLSNAVLPVGIFFVPIFMLVTLLIYSGGIIDGIDGLAGGIFAIIFSAYSVIAFANHQINLSALCAVIVGGLLAFLWFNIPPARFYMSETGTMALTITLAVIAFMTDRLGEGRGVVVLPIVALPLVITTLSVIVQLLSKYFRNGQKVFQVAPLHHHFH